MSFEEAFRKIFNAGYDIEPVCNCDYLYEIDGVKGMFSEEAVIEFAENM
jgi:hypothetical protein